MNHSLVCTYFYLVLELILGSMKFCRNQVSKTCTNERRSSDPTKSQTEQKKKVFRWPNSYQAGSWQADVRGATAAVSERELFARRVHGAPWGLSGTQGQLQCFFLLSEDLHWDVRCVNAPHSKFWFRGCLSCGSPMSLKSRLWLKVLTSKRQVLASSPPSQCPGSVHKYWEC